jgi:hypothetical protein
MDAEDIGIGDSPEKVAAFHAERFLVMAYFNDAHGATTRRLSMISTEQFDYLVVYALGDERPVWTALVECAVIRPSILDRLPTYEGCLQE